MSPQEKQIELAKRLIPMGMLDVHLNKTINKLPCLAQVIECIAHGKGFGLKSKDNTIIFDPEKLVVYDFAGGNLSKTDCKDNTQFLNYLKLAAVCHTTFISAQTCIEMVKPKKLIQVVDR